MSNLNPKQLAALRLLEEGEEYRNYFFKKATGLIWFKPIKEKGYFRAVHNPKPKETEKGLYTIPYWPVLDYLEKISHECGKPENCQYAEELMEIIRDVTRPRDGEKTDNYRTWWRFARVMANLPTHVIKLKDIELIADWLDSQFTTSLVDHEIASLLMPKLLKSASKNDWEKAAKLLEVVTRIRVIEKKYSEDHVVREVHAAIDAHYLREMFKLNYSLLGEKCGKEVIEILKARLKEALKPKKDDLYSHIWRPAIEDHEQNVGDNDVRNILIAGLRNILVAYSIVQTLEASETLQTLLHEKLVVLQRIALHVINKHFELYQKLFWQFLKPKIFSTNLQHELFLLLKTHFSGFTPPQQKKVIDMITKLKGEWQEESDKKLLDARLRLDWLQAINGQGNKRADQLYEKYLKIAKYPSEHPEFASYSEISVGEVAPCSVEELLSKNVPEVIQYLNTFKESGQWREPTEGGLAEVLKIAVKQKPEKFEDDLRFFLNTKPVYQNAVIRAFEDLWNGKKIFDWGKILELCQSIVAPDEFWQDAGEAKEPDRRPTSGWVASTICSLIEDGMKSDEWAFEEAHLPAAEKIILRILGKQRSTANGREGNALNEALNTPKGQCLMALLNYCLRRSRLYDKKKETRSHFWENIQPVFDSELDQCAGGNFEFSSLAGAHLPNLNYLNKRWVEINIDRIFSVNHESNWRCAMEGYAYVNTFYIDIYQLLKDRGHLKIALQADFKDEHVRQKLIQSISIAYLRGVESLSESESLLEMILTGWRAQDIFEIISVFWRHHHVKELDEGPRNLILDFWRYCHEKIRGHEADNASILSDLNLLAVFLIEISDEHKAWLLQSAPYVDERYHSTFFLEYLENLTDQNPEAVAEVFLKMLTKAAPTFKIENVRSIVEKLYRARLREQANEICNQYALRGHTDLLKDLYDQQN